MNLINRYSHHQGRLEKEEKIMKLRTKYFWTTLPILLLVTGTSIAAPNRADPEYGDPNYVTGCGTVITEPGKYMVVNDLACGPSEGGIRILASDVSLNLGGFALSCDLSGNPYSGVVVGDDMNPEVYGNIRISNGTVTGCGVGVLIWFADGVRVTKMSLIDNPESAVTVVEAMNIVVKHNAIEGGAWAINSYESSGNSFDHNTIHYSAYGIDMYGETDSRVMCNTVDQGFYTLSLGPYGSTPSSGNLIRGNRVTNSYLGIGLFGGGTPEDGLIFPQSMDNLVHANISQGNWLADVVEVLYDVNTYDIFLDPGVSCMNTWKNNQFDWSVGPPGCIGEPVDLDEICAMEEDDD
ncbi:MAG: right-handed parallel beta-helix repeat-containing protein [Lysobacterales bacterium]|jgi:hypothetical protein